jgi:hypothetical protein
MLVISANSEIPRPDETWFLNQTVQVTVNLPARVVPFLNWLSERWSIPVPVIAADMLVAITSGRYLLAQLTGHHLQPDQGPRGMNSAVMNLQLLSSSVEALKRITVPSQAELGHKCGQLLLDYMQGVLNPQLVSFALPDPDGEKLRKDDDSLKVHMPEGLDTKINALARYHEVTVSDIIRNTFLLHVYGRIRYELWTSEGLWRPKRKATKEEVESYRGGDIRFSPARTVQQSPVGFSRKGRTEFIQEHGKSVEPTRVFMPPLLKQRIEDLADERGIRVSEYCRRALVALI